MVLLCSKCAMEHDPQKETISGGCEQMEPVGSALQAKFEEFLGAAALREVARLQWEIRGIRNYQKRRRGYTSEGPHGTPGRPVGRVRRWARMILTSRPDISYAGALQYLILYDRVEWAVEAFPDGDLQLDKVPEPSWREAERLKRALDAEWPSARLRPQQLPRGYYRYQDTGGRLALLEALDSPPSLAN